MPNCPKNRRHEKAGLSLLLCFLSLTAVHAPRLERLRKPAKKSTAKRLSQSNGPNKKTVFIESSALWRGYLATWMLNADTLRFRRAENHRGESIDSRGLMSDGDVTSRYTGELHAGSGKIILYSNYFKGDSYEYETVYTLRNDIVTDTQKYRNRLGDRLARDDHERIEYELIRTPLPLWGEDTECESVR